MTRDRDIERVLDRFYAEGPSEMPDRLLLGVIDRIERVPQRRLAFKTRFATMNATVRLAAAAAIVVAVVGVGAFALSQRPSVGPLPTPAPSSTASRTPAPSLSTLSAAFRYKWVGAPRTVAQIVPPITCSRLLMGTGQLEYNGCGPNSILDSKVGLASPSTIVFTLISNEYGCVAGDMGTYTVTMSANGKALSLATVADACAARAGAVAGDWNRSDCPDASSPCLGPLDAGRYVSANFNPFVPHTAWVANYAALAYTVPAGWTNIEDCDGCYTLARQGAPDSEGIFLFSDVAAHLQDAACTNDVAPGVGQTASAIATWLTTLSGLTTEPPTPVTLGGLHGVTLDVSIAPSWKHACSYSDGQPAVPLFTDPLKGGFDWGVAGAGRMRVNLLDLPDGRVLLVEFEAASKSAFDALVTEATPVVQSFQFKP
jgi:hypothetical protein